MLSYLLKSLKGGEEKKEAPRRSVTTQEVEKAARVEAVRRTLRLYTEREVSVRELSNAAQVHERQLKRILIQLTADGEVAFDGHRVRLIS